MIYTKGMPGSENSTGKLLSMVKVAVCNKSSIDILRIIIVS